jgi:hypothetical protein
MNQVVEQASGAKDVSIQTLIGYHRDLVDDKDRIFMQVFSRKKS